MVGLFALPDGENGIKFIPFDNLSANRPTIEATALMKSICLMSGRLGTKGNFSPKDISPLADNVRFKFVLDPASDAELKYPLPLNKLLLTWYDIGRNVAILVLSIHISFEYHHR